MMKTRPCRIFLHLLLLVALSSALPCSAAVADTQWKPVTEALLRKLHLDRRFHKCIAVADGDTITLEDLGTIRFIGVDTPEKNHPMLPVQFMSRESSDFIRKLCLGKNIRLEYDPYDENKRGNYGRILAYPYLENGTFVQKQLLINGYATAYTKYPFDEQRKNQFLTWEQKAKQERRGLWKDRGTDEVLWILSQRHLLIQVEKVSAGNYRLWIGNWASRIFQNDQISLNLLKLYATAHELAPGGLRKQLVRYGYKEKAIPEPTTEPVSVIGMAHKKWGIIYGNHAKPRVFATELGTQIHELFKWVQDFDTELLYMTLSLNNYHPIPEPLIPAVNPLEIAEGFLKTEPLEKNNGRRVSWELAGKYVGKRVTVQGKIVRSFNSGKACFLNFHRNFTRYMSLTIFKNAFRKFPFQPEKYYLNKTVRVKGKIRKYEGRPEIIVESPRQIEIVKKQGKGLPTGSRGYLKY